uniref:NAD-dependent epimerase/dehydratase n=1 Tax=Solibacter usitatus (strain Ellin6076) TaxID=234267 RepID=Q025T2_SOLUE
MRNSLERDLDHVLSHTEELWAEVRGERIFMTGGTGFVGTWLTESLLWANRRLSLGVHAVLLTRDPDAFRRRSPHLAEDPAVTLLAGDGPTFPYPDGDFPLVVHAATERHAPPGPACPASTLDRDLAATRRVLELARTHGARRLLFTSSGAVYGRQPASLRHVPEDYPGAPLSTDTASAYGQGKRISEYLCACYSQVYGFDAVIGRLFAFVGPHLPLDANYAVGNFIRDAFGGGPVKIAGDGTPYRSYLYAADLAIWLWTLLIRGQKGTAYNVGSPHEVSIADLARVVVREIAPQAGICIAGRPVTGAPALRYVPSTDRAAALGLHPWIPLEEGIRRTRDWCRVQLLATQLPG